MKRPAAVKELIEELKRLPGIGQKTAERLSFFLMRGEKERVEKLARAIVGIKEKVIAAKSAGIKRVILPTRNETDLEDVSDNVRNALKFHFVDEMEDVLDLAFGEVLRQRPKISTTEGPEPDEDAENEIPLAIAGDGDGEGDANIPTA